MNIEERKKRVVARGEFSNHAHVIIGGEIRQDGTLFVEKDGGAKIAHILETEWLQGRETWSKEHHEIPLEAGVYQFSPQLQSEFDPYQGVIRQVAD